MGSFSCFPNVDDGGDQVAFSPVAGASVEVGCVGEQPACCSKLADDAASVWAFVVSLSTRISYNKVCIIIKTHKYKMFKEILPSLLLLSCPNEDVGEACCSNPFAKKVRPYLWYFPSFYGLTKTALQDPQIS